MCFTLAYFAANSPTIFLVDGLVIEDVNTLILPPAFTIPSNFAPIALSTASQVVAVPLAVGPVKRAESYKDKTDACTRALVPPFVILEYLFPSILIGRPSRVFTNTEQKSLPSEYVEAYQLAIPGLISSGLKT